MANTRGNTYSQGHRHFRATDKAYWQVRSCASCAGRGGATARTTHVPRVVGGAWWTPPKSGSAGTMQGGRPASFLPLCSRAPLKTSRAVPSTTLQPPCNYLAPAELDRRPCPDRSACNHRLCPQDHRQKKTIACRPQPGWNPAAHAAQQQGGHTAPRACRQRAPSVPGTGCAGRRLCTCTRLTNPRPPPTHPTRLLTCHHAPTRSSNTTTRSR